MFFLIITNTFIVSGQGDGFLVKENMRLFPIGWYYTPEDDIVLKELAEAGFNILRCNSKKELDRVHSVGIQGWVSLPFQHGVNENFKERVKSILGHPALALLEGPDEVVLSFTQDYQYHLKGKYDPYAKIIPWRDRKPEQEEYAKERAPEIMKNIHEAISFLRNNDSNNLQIWINEGAHSSPFYVRQYLGAIDITGCDYYPINGERGQPPNMRPPNRRIELIGYITKQWKEISMGKPVYIILQAFSWPDLGSGEKYSSPAFPSFNESRYMAYSVIAHGGNGIFYYGGNTIGNDGSETSEIFRQSLYSLASELNVLQPFLTSPEQKHVTAYYLKDFQRKEPSSSLHENHVAWSAKQFGREWIIILVNNENVILQNVAVKGLKHLDEIKFYELYGSEEIIVTNEEFITTLKPYEVKVFATNKKWETNRLIGRNYNGFPSQNK